MRTRTAWWSLAAVGLVALVLVAVRRSQEASAPAPTASGPEVSASPPSAEPPIAVGSRVVFAVTAATFGEGEVKRIDGDQVTVVHRPAGRAEELTVDRGRMAPLSARASDPRPGEHLICRTAPATWQGCRVVELEGARIRGEDPRGRSVDLDPAALLRPSAAMQQEIADYLALHARYRAFDDAVRTAGRPRRPAGWRPKKGDAVIALQTGTSWYGGVVEAVVGTSVKLSWQAPKLGRLGSRATAATAVSVYDVAPPPTAPQALTVGQYGLVRPTSVERRWEPHQVVDVVSDGYRVADRDGRRKSVSAGDIVPLLDAGPTRSPDAEFIPSEPEVVDAMLELAEVRRQDVVYDLGCGDGRILVAAAKKYGARAVGYDIDPARVAESRDNARRHGVEHLVRVEEADIFTVDLSDATVVAIYLSEELNTRLVPQLRRLRPGARIVSHAFGIRGIAPLRTIVVAVEGRHAVAVDPLPAGHPHPGSGTGEAAQPPSGLQVHLWRAPLAGR